MSDLPAGWTWATIGSIAESLVDGPFGSNLKTQHYRSSGIRVIRLQNIADGHFLDADKAYVTEEHAKKLIRHEARSGDVLIASMGDVLPRVCLVPSYVHRAIVKADCFRLRPRKGILPEYLVYILSAPQMRKRASREIAGVGRPRLNLRKVAALDVPIPPQEEQERIVAAVERRLSLLDTGIVTLEQIKTKLGTMRSAALEFAIKVAEAAAVENTALKDVVSPGRKIAYGVLVPGAHDPHGIPLVRVGDLKNRQVSGHLKCIASSVSDQFPRTLLQGGEVLLSLVGTIGRTAVVPSDLAGANVARALAVIPVKDKVDPRYIAMTLSRTQVTKELNSLSHEVARKTLNLEDVRNYSVPLPDYATQIEIAREVEAAESWISTIDTAIEQTVRRAHRLRSAVLAAAFSGRLT